MKGIEISINQKYKSFIENTKYEIEGDLIIISGINGSGKSQLLQIIANNSGKKINRIIKQKDKNGTLIIENILLLSFRDNINLGNNFGSYSLTFKQRSLDHAWRFYEDNIKFKTGYGFKYYEDIRQKFRKKDFIYRNESKSSDWISIEQIVDLLNKNFVGDDIFKLTKDEFTKILPSDFIWRNDNDIIEQTGNLFYKVCCERADKQIEYSSKTEIFNNEEWLKNAPWTILNKLFDSLGFKYKFKDDYGFKMPNMEENPQLRISEEIRDLSDLSDGEKAILKLALVSMDEDISKNVKLVLFDEYDAPLNPSLIESFYKVIDEFYIQKGIQIILTTHSPATISLAPEYTQFYEIFSQENSSPKLIKVNQFDYAELKEANKSFYSKLQNQKDRILELENTLRQQGNALLVEDEYCQIYKIAYLKIKDIKGITENNLEELFNKVSTFSINGGFSSGGLYNYLNCGNTTLDENCKRICLFDFDNEGYSKYEKLMSLKKNNQKLYLEQHNELNTGLCLKHVDCNRYAMMIPILDRLKDFVSTSTSSDCFIEIETLIDSEYLKNNNKANQRSPILQFYKLKDKHKCDFWKDLLSADKSIFNDFKPLFKTVETIFNS